jgi:hypothetical protein
MAKSIYDKMTVHFPFNNMKKKKIIKISCGIKRSKF